MAGLGNFNFSQLVELQKKLERLGDPDKFIERCAKQIAAQLLRKVTELTPPKEDYPSESGKEGGNLKREWYVGKIKQSGDTLCIEVINPVWYASYVEYGHRQTPGRYVPAIGKKLKKSWVEGKFMLKIASQEVQEATPAALEKKIQKYLKELL